MAIKRKKITVSGFEYDGVDYDSNAFCKKATDDLYDCFKAYITRVCELSSVGTSITIDELLNLEDCDDWKETLVTGIAGAVSNCGADGKYPYELQSIRELSEELCEFYY